MGGAAVAGRDCRWFRNWSYDSTYQGSHRDRYVARHDRSANLYRPHNPRPHYGPRAGNDRCSAGSPDRCARCCDPTAPAGNHRRGPTARAARRVLRRLA